MLLVKMILLAAFVLQSTFALACDTTHSQNRPWAAIEDKEKIHIVGRRSVPKKYSHLDSIKQAKGFYITWSQDGGWGNPKYYSSMLVGVVTWRNRLWILSRNGELLVLNKTGDFTLQFDTGVLARELFVFENELVITKKDGSYLSFDGESVTKFKHPSSEVVTSMIKHDGSIYLNSYDGLHRRVGDEWKQVMQWPMTDHVRLAVNSQGKMVAADRKTVYSIEDGEIVSQRELHPRRVELSGHTVTQKIAVSRDDKFVVSSNCNEYVVTDGEEFWEDRVIPGIYSITHLFRSNNENTFYVIAVTDRSGTYDAKDKGYYSFSLLQSTDLEHWKNIGYPPLPVY